MAVELHSHLFTIPEIQDGIFSHSNVLSKSDLARCACVSKAWHQVVNPYLWKTVFESEDQKNLTNQQGVITNAEWIRDLTVTRWEMIEWLNDSGKCRKLSRLGIRICRNSIWISEKPIFTAMKKEDQEKEDENVLKLNTLIGQNDQLQEFCYTNKDINLGYFNLSTARALMNSGSLFHLFHLELIHVYWRDSSFFEILNQCGSILKRLIIRRCTFEMDFLNPLKNTIQFSNLEQLIFTTNWVATDNKKTVENECRFAAGQDWLPLLIATKTSSRFHHFEVESKLLTDEQVFELIHLHGMVFRNLTVLSFYAYFESKQVVEILDLVQPLKILRFNNVVFAGKVLEIVKLKHEASLEELCIFSTTDNQAQIPGLLSVLKLPKLKCLMIQLENLSFETFVPQLYDLEEEEENEEEAEEEEKEEEEVEEEEENHHDDGSNLVVRSLAQKRLTFETKKSHVHDWTCLEAEEINIIFDFDPRLELEVLGGSWNSKVRSREELFVKGFLLLIDQLSRLPKLTSVDITVNCSDRLSTNSVHWIHLDGCWNVFSKEMRMVDFDWPAPYWIHDKYLNWRREKFRARK